MTLISLTVLVFMMASKRVHAQGGPPMLTDDPATPGDGNWEINFLSTLEQSRAGRMFETPNIDLNYGLGNHLQLKFEVPWLVLKSRDVPSASGLGNSTAGIKWRFVDEEDVGFDMSIYPQLEFNNPTKSVARGLAESGTRLFLPVEVAKRFGSVEVAGEVGYGIVQHGPNEAEYGILFARSFSSRFELMCELHGSTLRGFKVDELFFNAGSRVRLSKNAVLVFSGGETIRNSTTEGSQIVAAVGIQFSFKKPL